MKFHGIITGRSNDWGSHFNGLKYQKMHLAHALTKCFFYTLKIIFLFSDKRKFRVNICNKNQFLGIEFRGKFSV